MSFTFPAAASCQPHIGFDNNEWTMIPDTEFNMYMIDLNNATTSEPVPHFDATTGVIFELYTLHNPFDAEILQIGKIPELFVSHFNGTRPTRIVLHGWNTNGGVTTTFQNGIIAVRVFYVVCVCFQHRNLSI